MDHGSSMALGDRAASPVHWRRCAVGCGIPFMDVRAAAQTLTAKVLTELSEERRRLFALRLDRWWPDLVEGLTALSGEYASRAVALRVTELAASAYRDRDPDLHRLDLVRSLQQYWLPAPSVVGYAAYADRFAGDLAGVARRIPYLQELGLLVEAARLDLSGTARGPLRHPGAACASSNRLSCNVNAETGGSAAPSPVWSAWRQQPSPTRWTQRSAGSWWVMRSSSPGVASPCSGVATSWQCSTIPAGPHDRALQRHSGLAAMERGSGRRSGTQPPV